MKDPQQTTPARLPPAIPLASAGRVPSSAVAETSLPDGKRRLQTYQRWVLLPLVLFVATCISTFWTGASGWQPYLHMASFEQAGRAMLENWQPGLIYMGAVLGILLPHELGHFLVALRYRIPASLPYFIPVPFIPLGTMGAVIGMRGSQANRRELFDLGVAGPLAGLAVALPVVWIGIRQLDPAAQQGIGYGLHNPLIIKLLIDYLRPECQDSSVLFVGNLNPLLMAGWVGMFVTGINMLPISQLDGGHVAYALFGRYAHMLARTLLIVAILFIVIAEQYHWVLMLVLVTLLGTDHPATADDTVPLGWPRRLIGWASLAIPILCFPPMLLSEVAY